MILEAKEEREEKKLRKKNWGKGDGEAATIPTI
jgi:hypothetical protein